MKVERQINSPDLVTFARRNLPESLAVDSYSTGYATCYCIYQKGTAPWIGRGDPVAEIDAANIALFHTNYFSDMEKLALAYERETGHEVTLKYWQSPKDAPIA